jgi:hypothetical protein
MTPRGYFTGYNICIDKESGINAIIIEDNEDHFFVMHNGSVIKMKGNVETYNPFIAINIIVPSREAEETIKYAYRKEKEHKI